MALVVFVDYLGVCGLRSLVYKATVSQSGIMLGQYEAIAQPRKKLKGHYVVLAD